jgi:hypothetical protein
MFKGAKAQSQIKERERVKRSAVWKSKISEEPKVPLYDTLSAISSIDRILIASFTYHSIPCLSTKAFLMPLGRDLLLAFCARASGFYPLFMTKLLLIFGYTIITRMMVIMFIIL